MRANILKLIPHAACATFLLFSMGVANATVSLTAQETTTTLPDGQTVRMWGLTCGVADATDPNTCTALNPAATPDPNFPLPAWQPPLITVQMGSTLTIALTNNLKVPTSLVIVGQLGGGLGNTPNRNPSPAHNAQGTTWPGTLGGTAAGDPVFTPPAQLDRVSSFSTEVPPPDATTGTATTTTLTWTNMQPGTYLLETGTHPSIQGPMGLYGIVVVTSSTTDATTGITTNTAYPANSVFPNGVTYDKDVPVLLSEIDPVQNAAVQAAVDYPAGQNGHTFNPLIVWSGAIGACGDVTVDIAQHWCYPPAVNYSPRYYLMNGVSFDRNNISASTLAGPAAALTTGNVLLRFVNAGLRMHVPSVVGLNMDLIARDGNVQPGLPKVMSEVFMAAGKTFDMMVHPSPNATDPTSYNPAIYPVFDRELSLSANNHRDGGMQAYITVNTTTTSTDSASANADTYYLIAGNKLSVTDPSRGVVANDVGVYGVHVLTPPSAGTLILNPDGTFNYTPTDLTTVTPDTFSYCANGTVSGTTCSSGHTATVTLAACTGSCLGAAPTANADAYTSPIATRLHINAPGVLDNDRDPAGLPMKAVLDSVDTAACPDATVALNDDGSFTATGDANKICTFTYHVQNSQNTSSAATATVSITFPTASGLQVSVKDAKTGAAITDYRWIIEEDTTVYIDPNRTTTGAAGGGKVLNTAVNFHTSFTPVVAQGCVGAVSCEAGQTILDPTTGTHVPAVCDVGDGSCRQVTGATDTTTVHKTEVNPSEVYLDPNKRYYISILPGDGSNPILAGATPGVPTVGTDGVGHTMGGAEIAAGKKTVDVFLEPTPLIPAKLAIFVFEDDNPLNGEPDTGGGVDVLAPNEAGLGEFAITLFDQGGGLGDATGQITYDEFNMPVSNSLAGTIDPSTGFDACPISKNPDRLVGTIITCPKYESDGVTLSPLAGHAVVDNLYAGLYEVVASPDAQRIARGEEWLQTNTLDGTKPIEAFIKPGEPNYFQEFGPGGYHVYVGFANADIINKRKASVCATQDCTATLNGQVTGLHMSRTPDERVYSTGNYDTYSYTQCYASLGAPDAADFAFAKCDGDGKFTFKNVPAGNLKVTVFDQWNDILVDGLSTPVVVNSTNVDSSTNTHCSGTPLVCNYEIAVTQWRTNLYGRVFLDQNGDGVSQADEPGLPLVSYNVKMRDGSYFGFNATDLNGYASFNETFPILNWLVVDIDSTRYKMEGIHVVYDAGGGVDGSSSGIGTSSIGAGLANTVESPTAHVPADLRFPGSRYCADADCTGTGSFDPTSGNPGSTGRVDPGWVGTEGWQGLLGQNSFVEYAMKPFAPGENGGIKGIVNYASTRPFDDPALLLQMSWAPNVPNVTVNLYQKTTDAFGNEKLNLVDTTKTTSWDDFAQGFRKDASGNLISVTDPSTGNSGYVPNMNCPGQETTSPFWFTLQGSTEDLNPTVPMAYDGRYKCFDGWAMLNQVQPAPINGQYHFPSVVYRDPTSGVPTGTGTAVNAAGGSVPGTNCTICVNNPDDGTPMLPTGDYVVEVVVPPGYELVKEEDKNILLGDAYVAPVTQQLAGLGNIFIMPDQAQMNETYNPYNSLDRTTNQGAQPRHEGDTGSVESFWPCVGKKRIVPDFNSLYPGAQQAAPFAGATRALCDRKEVVLSDQMTALTKFYIFTSTHVASHFTGTITNDFASEFDPFSPQFGEKFAVPNTPVAIKDFTGKEIARVYSDQWGVYDGMTFSSYTVNPPDPSGYLPQVMVMCMNDPGPIPDPSGATDANGNPVMITDPLYNPAYSDYCYEWTFMPGQTSYLDTPVIPTMAFADRYNLPDCEYPDTTPAIKTVIGDSFTDASSGVMGAGPWVSASGHTLTITALGDMPVLNHAYSGPNMISAPYNEKFVTRHYGFGTQGPNSKVTIGGVAATVTSWSDTQIQVSVPGNVPLCSATNPTYTGDNATARCGELEITADNGKKSIDTVTVTVGGRTPSYVTPNSPSVDTFGKIQPSPLQTAIDKASPGDLIIVGPGTYHENLFMWKPVRLQGVGAESVTINADAHPAGKMDAWRRQADCLFGLSLNGRPLLNDGTGTYGTGVAYDPSNTYTCPADMQQRVDRIPFETIIGWDTTGNGNLAQQLQEPTLMGAYEGAGITVLGRGVWIPDTSTDFWGSSTAGNFPAGYQWVTGDSKYCTSASTTRTDGRDYGTSNFFCNPSRIDGLSVINSSQGGGAIWAHAWNHYLDIANNRIHGNHGTLTGGISIGNGEFPDPYIVGGATTPPVGQPMTGLVGNQRTLVQGEQNGYGFNQHVWVHNNDVTSNASVGDALYSGTPSAAGGVSFCTGSDTYLFNNNFVCGNLSTGDSGGVSHIGFSNDATIANNTIIFNQSHNPTIPVNAGGLGILGASPDRILPNGTECGAVTDSDCPPGLPEGTGRNLVIDGNLIMGNSAESGTGGGLRLQMVNGQDVVAFPQTPAYWNNVSITNNIIADNVAGWDGGGVSLQDALKVSFVNNTVSSNDTTASAGVLFNTLGAPFAATPPPGCTPGSDPSATCPPTDYTTHSVDQVAGLVTMQNTPNLVAAIQAIGPQGVRCPTDNTDGTNPVNGACRDISYPKLLNNLFWENRAFHIDVGNLGTGTQNQQAVVTLVPTLNQTSTGLCVANGTAVTGATGSGDAVVDHYWDIGVRLDTGPTNHNSGYTLQPQFSVLSATGTDYSGNGNIIGAAANPVIQMYCNGSRIPPEAGGPIAGYTVPPGHSETTGLYPLFSLNQITPAATVDEGNNWINLGYGPLSLSNAASYTAPNTLLPPLGNYGITSASPAYNGVVAIPPTDATLVNEAIAATAAAPNIDFFGNPRPKTRTNPVDIGAVEVQ